MNVPSHVTGQMPNQGATRLSGLPPQNGGGGSQMQGLAGTSGMDQDLSMARKLMREKIIQFFQRHKVTSGTSGWLHRLPDIVKRVEECLFRNAATKEDYMNMETLDRRLFNIVKILNSQSIAQRAASSSPAPVPAPMSTMIPTPGMSHSSNTGMAVSSADSTIAVTGGPGMLIENAAGTRNMLQHSGGVGSIGRSGSFNASNGSITDGYQQSSAGNSVGSMPPLDLSHSSSQMIPTPGLNNMQSMPLSVNSRVESIAVPQQQPQKQFIGNQNLGGQLGVGLRSNMQSRYGFPNGGLTYSGNNSQLVNGSIGSEAYLNIPPLNNSVKPAQQHFEQQHHPSLRPRDSYGINNQAGSGNMYSGGASSGSGLNSQSISSLNMQSRPKINMSSQAYQSNLQPVQQTAQKPTLLDHSQKMEFGTPHSVRENMMNNPKQVQKFQHQQFQPQTTQSYPQFVPHQFQQQQRHLVENDSYRQPFMSSSFGGQILPEQGMESINEPLISQAPEEFNIPDLPGQYHQNSMLDDSSMGTKLGGQLPAQILSPSRSQGPQQVNQNFHSNQHVHAQNDLTSLQTGSQPDVLLQGQWHSQTPQNSNILDQTSFQHHIHNDFHQRLNGQNESQQPQFSEGSISGLVAANGMSVPKSSLVSRDMENSLRSKHHLNQIRWLLFLRHAHRCPAPKGKCAEVHCLTVQQLLAHIEKCTTNECKYPRCQKSKILMDHHQRCQRADCPVCIPVRDYVASKCKPRPPPESSVMHETNGSVHTAKALDSDKPVSKSSSSSIEISEDLQPPKRMKVEHPSSLGSKFESCSLPVHENQLHAFDAQMQVNTSVDEHVPAQPEVISVKMEPTINVKTEPAVCSVPSGPENLTNLRRDDINDSKSAPPPRSGESQAKLEVMEIDQETTKQEAPSCDPVSGTKSGKPKIKGVSLIELFTPEQVRQHIIGLRQWVGQSKAKAEKNQAMEHAMTENSCQLCAVEKLIFEPPPIYCTPCGARIKRNAMYYNFGSGDTRQCFCIPCYNEARGDTIEVEGLSHPMPKAKLEKRRNDEETEEWWVQCDKCEAWQHQICALFNSRRNEGGEAEYTCPNCYVQEVERGERIPLPESAVLGADDLPRTALSDHLEQRLFRRLKQERLERARHLGKSPEEVAGAESLVVRVVLSVDKKLEVKQRFLEIFQEDNYPTEFPYKSKVVLLFQKIEGVEVCLFGMYVQEFGSESSFPNQRRVYLSYLDSVKYFRPDIKTVTGEALRTFVYHEILIGYLEYCKKRGFTSCYIWACPPLKGEDYILYCHPEIQKTPKSDKLREWYLVMLRKAVKENIVADLTNLYDHFFITTGECKAKVTAARLPYFDGDYWPGAAEDMINQLQQEEDGSKQHKKGKTKKTLTKRALKAAGQTDLSGNASKDALLMQKLGETIYPMKEDFIMVHLQHACTHCCNLMVSGVRWVCSQCKKFQLCEKCYDAEQKLDERDRHPIHGREKHFLNPVAITDVSTDTKDKDDILESEFFDTRQAFLSLCQGNHYQYDTLRRAKHSSMMVLYHLHNPTAPAFVTTCNVCYHDIEAGQNWHCEVCPDFDVCNSCYKKEGGIDHPHKLTNHPSMADAQNTEARQQRVFELRRMLDLLVHASRCRHVLPNQPMGCQYPDCRKVKGLFAHGSNCQVRASRGCILCKRMWSLLHLHARACKESKCLVPRCKDLKEHLKRSQRQSDSRRRAAVMEMMRQRAAEVAGGSG